MKPIEEAFASRGFRRVILPGIVLTVGLHPLLRKLIATAMSEYGITEAAVVLVVEIVFWGLVVSSATDRIYYIYEGFTLSWLTGRNKSRLERKLKSLVERFETLRKASQQRKLTPAESDQFALTYEELGQFPLERDDAGVPRWYVDRSTQLGNVIATYELYARTRYGVDGVFFWYHLLNLAPTSARSEFDEQYGFAESLVLTSFSGVVLLGIHLLLLLGWSVSSLCTPCAIATAPTPLLTSLVLAAFGLMVFVVFYELAVPAHREAAKMIRAIVDAAMPQFVTWAKTATLPLPSDDATLISKTQLHMEVLR